jgi:hypothetical protein
LDYWDYGEDIFPRRALAEEAMTTIARLHTPEGFAVAADGRMAYGTRVASDEAQKIVSLRHACGVMSCAGFGVGKIGMRSFTDIAQAAIRCIDLNPINYEQHLANLGKRFGALLANFRFALLRQLTPTPPSCTLTDTSATYQFAEELYFRTMPYRARNVKPAWKNLRPES